MGLHSKKRIKLAERAGWKCVWCGQTVRKDMGWQNSTTVEHLMPVSAGGSNKLENLACACYRCNRVRGTQAVTEFQAQAVNFLPDRRTCEEADHADKKLKRKLKQEKFKQIVGHQNWSYVHVPDSELNAKERMRKDRTRVRNALKQSRHNPFDVGTRCHRMFEAECAKLTPQLSIWSQLWNKLTAWCGSMHSVITHRENRHENCVR